MNTKDFLLHLKSLRAQFEVSLLTGIEYNRKLLQLHADHAAAMLVEQPGPKVVHEPVAVPVLALSLTRKQVDWAKSHDWFLSSGLDVDGYYVTVIERYGNDQEGILGRHVTFRDYNELRTWAGY